MDGVHFLQEHMFRKPGCRFMSLDKAGFIRLGMNSAILSAGPHSVLLDEGCLPCLPTQAGARNKRR